MRLNTKPDIGTKMYSVHENLYYIEGHAGPILEYCVCEAEVTGFFRGGYTEACLRGLSPKGYRTPYRYKLSDIGAKIFYTVQEAAELAKKMTENYEHTWGWMGAPDIPLIRTWEKYLLGDEIMRNISAMYEVSGGSDPFHICGECARCVTEIRGKHKVNKCSRYSELTKTNPDWKTSYIACKYFTDTQEAPKRGKAKQDETELPGQMSFDDFPEVMP